MTIDRIIALVTAIAALVAACVTFWTVRQMVLQRQDSYRPDLVPTKVMLRAIGGSGHCEFRLFKQDLCQQAEHSETWSGFTFFNLGLAAAKDVKAVWEIDIKSYCDAFNRIAQRSLTSRYAIYDRGILRLGCRLHGEEIHVVKSALSHSWPYVLPASIEHNRLMVSFPQFLVVMYGLSIDSEVAQLVDVPTLPAVLQLSYSDLGGNTHAKNIQPTNGSYIR